ncbi:MAG: PD-(D/E)XK nuclease family protein [Synergistales bacterium]|nr:PD-(D/E)XK nuclease family protein [Synergistales bacterium]
MALHLKGYGSLDDLALPLREAAGERAVFVLPSMRETKGLESLLAREGPVAAWSWRRLCNEIFRAAGTAGRPVLDNSDRRLLLEALDGAAALPASFLTPLGDDVRELLRQEVPPEEFALGLDCKDCRPDCPHREEAEGRLCRLYHGYAALLAERDLVDSAALESRAAQALDEAGRAFRERWRETPFLFVGFLSLTRGQLSLIRRLQALDLDMTLFHPLTGLEDYPDAAVQLADIAASLSRQPLSSPPRIHRLCGGDGRLEADLLCRELALWSRAEGAFADGPFPGWEKIAVVAGEETALVEESLRRYRIPYVSRRRLSMADGTIWRLLCLIDEAARDGWPFEETALLLANPLLAGKAFPYGKALRRRPRGFEAWRDFLSPWEEAGRCLDEIAAFASVIAGGETASKLLAETVRFLRETLAAPERMARLAGDDIDLDEEGRAVNGALKELSRRLELLESAGESLKEWSGLVLEGERAFAFLSFLAQESSLLPPLPLAKAVSLYGGELPVLESAPVVALLSMDHRRWPGKGAEGPFLSERLLRSLHEQADLGPLHLPTAQERRRAREGLFRRLVASGREVLLCRALQDDSGRPLEETAFVERAIRSGWAVEGKRLELPLSRLVATATEPFVASVEVVAELPGRRRSRPTASRAAGEEPVAALSGLDRFSDCPFLYSRNDLPSVDIDLFDRAELGSFLHRVWQAAWEGCRPGETPLAERAVAAFGELLKSEGGIASCLEAFPRQRGWLLDRLKRLGERLDEAEAGGLARARIASETEKPLPDLTLGGVTFRGRCDRIDRLRDGSLLLFDYKLGSSLAYRDHLQLAAYALALEESGQTVGGYVYLCHGDAAMTGALGEEARGILRLDSGMRKDFDGAVRKAREELTTMAAAVVEGRFDAAYESPCCTRCALAPLCRRDELRREDRDDEA